MKLLGQIRELWLSSGATPGNYGPKSSGTLSRCMLVGTMLTAIASLAGRPVKVDELSELKAEIRAMNKRLSEMEEQKGKVKALNDKVKQMERAKEAQASVPPPGTMATKAGPWDSFVSGRPVHIIETSGTEVLLYGIIEPTLGYTTNVNTKGAWTVGLNASWFNGNRSGIFVPETLFADATFN